MARGVGRSSGELTSSAPEGADLVSLLLIADMSNEITPEGGGWAGGPGVAHSQASGLNVSYGPRMPCRGTGQGLRMRNSGDA